MNSEQRDSAASPAVPVAQDEREAFRQFREDFTNRLGSPPSAWDVWQELRAALSAATPPAAVPPVTFTDDDWQAIADELDTIIFSRVKQAIDKRLAEKQQCK